MRCCLYLLLSLSAQALIDKADNFNALSNHTNIILAPDEVDANVQTAFGGDADRFTRDTAEPGMLTYYVPDGITGIRMTVFTKNDPDWELEATVGGISVLTLTAENVTAAINSQVRTMPCVYFV